MSSFMILFLRGSSNGNTKNNGDKLHYHHDNNKEFLDTRRRSSVGLDSISEKVNAILCPGESWDVASKQLHY